MTPATAMSALSSTISPMCPTKLPFSTLPQRRSSGLVKARVQSISSQQVYSMPMSKPSWFSYRCLGEVGEGTSST